MFRAHTPSYLEANSISQPGSSVYTSLALVNPAHWAHLPALLFGKGHPQLVAVPLLGGPTLHCLAGLLGLSLPLSNPVEIAPLVTEEPQERPMGSVMPTGSLSKPKGGISPQGAGRASDAILAL